MNLHEPHLGDGLGGDRERPAGAALQKTRSGLAIGAVPIDPVTLGDALNRIDDLVEAGEGGAVFTPNVDHVVLAEHEPDLRAAYARVDLSLADGMPVVWASRLLRRPVPEKVSGSDLVEPLMAHAAEAGHRVYLMGGADGAAEEAARRLVARHPGLTVVGVEAPRVDLARPDRDRPLLERIRAARPDLLLVALGCPKQEIWIHRNLENLAPAVALGVGASLDFIAGVSRRAPPWMSRAGLEWLYRLAQEPGRMWRRYLVRDPEFLVILGRTLLGGGATPRALG